jgi:hypothetical protein
MSDKKQTAVEWLLNQLESKGDARETSSIRNIQFNIDTSDYLEIKRQAKQMEKEQILDSYGIVETTEQGDIMNAEQYYNETYG